MAHESEVSLDRLEALYGHLLRISEQQLACIENLAQDDQFLARFQELSDEWSLLQAQVVAEEQQLLEWVSEEQRSAILRQKVGPIIRKTQDNMARAAEQMTEKLKSTGSLIRSGQDHRQASKAYYSTGYEDHVPVFFDEKK